MAALHELLAAATGFQWVEGNATKNWAKHEVTQAECVQVRPISRREREMFADAQAEEGSE